MVVSIVEFVDWLVVAVGEDGCLWVVVVHSCASVFLRLFCLVQRVCEFFGHSGEEGFFLEGAGASLAVAAATSVWRRAYTSSEYMRPPETWYYIPLSSCNSLR